MPPKNQKAKAGSKAKAKAKAKAGAIRRPFEDAADPEFEKRIESLVMQLWKLADVDESKLCGFNEFIEHHQRVMALASDALGRAECLSSDELTKAFRDADLDNSQALDKEEFDTYMAGLLSVIGKREFENLCISLVKDETARLAEMREGFDRRNSEILLEQARSTNYYKPQIKEAALELLHNKADPNTTDSAGTSVLLHMTSKIDASFAKVMLEARADLLTHSKDFDSPIFRAVTHRSMGVLRVFLGLEHPEQEAGGEEPEVVTKLSNELVQRAGELSAGEAKGLILKGADFNYKSDDGWTPLTMAVFQGRRELVESLILAQDANKTKQKLHLQGRNAKGRAALHLCARKDFPEIISLLVRGGADPDVKDSDGWTALHHACFNGNSRCVSELVGHGAKVDIKGDGGLTPFLTSRLPQRSGMLSEAAVKLVSPSEDVDFAKKIIPIIKEDRPVVEKIDDLLSLPGVHQNTNRLRLHDWFFDPVRGPNEVRLQKIWTLLVRPIIELICSGNVEMDLVPPPHLSEPAKLEHLEEIDRRRHLLESFLEHWLHDSKGLQPSSNWKFDSRGPYANELHSVVQSQLALTEKQLNELYEKLKEDDDGQELAASPPEETLDPNLLTQCNAHQIPVWLEDLDLAQAFVQLRLVGGIKGDDAAALSEFVEMLTISHDLLAGRQFWRHVYSYWLFQYAAVADYEFQRRLRRFVENFNQVHEEDELSATFKSLPKKRLERIREKALELSLHHGHDTYRGRTAAATMLDIVRCCIVAKDPKTVLQLLAAFRNLTGAGEKFKVVRVKNRFSEQATTVDGYRQVSVSVLFKCGLMPSPFQAGQTLEVNLVGEVRIALESFLALKDRRHLIHRLSKGLYDWGPLDAEEEGGEEVNMNCSLHDDDS